MNKGVIAGLAIVGVIAIIIVTVAVMYFSTSNSEIRLRNRINAVQLDNQNEFQLMWTRIEQVTQVTRAERESVERIIVSYADQRSGEGGGGRFINAVREAVPSVDNATFVNLQNTIVASRDRFANRQRQLIDLKREHDNIIMTFPGSIFVGSRPQVDITVVTSTRTQETFQTGLDDNIKLDL